MSTGELTSYSDLADADPNGIALAELGRAYRMAADWLEITGRSTADLRVHADQIDPPETVESLRAALAESHARIAALRESRNVHARAYSDVVLQRDALLSNMDGLSAERDAALTEADKWKTACLAMEAEEAAKVADARAAFDRVGAASSPTEATPGPPVWVDGDAEPEGVTRVRDRNGGVWDKQIVRGLWKPINPAWTCTWPKLVARYGPITEALP